MAEGRASGRQLRAAVDKLVEDGAALEEIERELIDGAALSADARDALWLYAWGQIERQRPPVSA